MVLRFVMHFSMLPVFILNPSNRQGFDPGLTLLVEEVGFPRSPQIKKTVISRIFNKLDSIATVTIITPTLTTLILSVFWPKCLQTDRFISSILLDING